MRQVYVIDENLRVINYACRGRVIAWVAEPLHASEALRNTVDQVPFEHHIQGEETL
jgi:hypothetical protein